MREAGGQTLKLGSSICQNAPELLRTNRRGWSLERYLGTRSPATTESSDLQGSMLAMTPPKLKIITSLSLQLSKLVNPLVGSGFAIHNNTEAVQ